MSKKESNKSSRYNISTIFGGGLVDVLMKKNIDFLALFFIFALLYIGNIYSCESKILKITELEEQLTDLKYQYLTLSSELIEISKQSRVKKMIKDQGIDINESITPPIKVNK